MRVKKLINAPAIIGYSSVVGKREYEGPLASDFDLHDSGEHFGMNTWEKAESEIYSTLLFCLAYSDTVSDIRHGNLVA